MFTKESERVGDNRFLGEIDISPLFADIADSVFRLEVTIEINIRSELTVAVSIANMSRAVRKLFESAGRFDASEKRELVTFSEQYRRQDTKDAARAKERCALDARIANCREIIRALPGNNESFWAAIEEVGNWAEDNQDADVQAYQTIMSSLKPLGLALQEARVRFQLVQAFIDSVAESQGQLFDLFQLDPAESDQLLLEVGDMICEEFDKSEEEETKMEAEQETTVRPPVPPLPVDALNASENAPSESAPEPVDKGENITANAGGSPRGEADRAGASPRIQKQPAKPKTTDSGTNSSQTSNLKVDEKMSPSAPEPLRTGEAKYAEKAPPEQKEKPPPDSRKDVPAKQDPDETVKEPYRPWTEDGENMTAAKLDGAPSPQHTQETSDLDSFFPLAGGCGVFTDADFH